MRMPFFQATTVFFFGTLWLCVPRANGQDDITGLLARLAGDPLDLRAVYALEGHPPEPRVLPALEAAFDTRQDKREKQEIATTLLRLGYRSGSHFDFLAAYARQAIEDRTPSFAKYDANGRSIQGEFSAEFENWCALNGKDPRSVIALQINVYPQDVFYLAKSRDPRGAALFRQGLDSPQPNVVAISVQGLARLQDASALPLIAKTCERLPVGARTAIALELPWYATPEADLLMQRLVPDRQRRDFYVKQVHQVRNIETKRAVGRLGGASTQK